MCVPPKRDFGGVKVGPYLTFTPLIFFPLGANYQDAFCPGMKALADESQIKK
jgi:hypothetical protein